MATRYRPTALAKKMGAKRPKMPEGVGEGCIPFSALYPIIEQALSKYVHEERTTQFCARTGFDEAVFRKWVTGVYKGVTFDNADHILCKLNLAYMWYEEPLKHWYWTQLLIPTRETNRKPPKVGLMQRVCARRGCSKTFPPNTNGGRAKIYCSQDCAQAQWNREKRGGKGRSWKASSIECAKGHDREKHGRKRPEDGSWICRECQRENERKYTAKNRDKRNEQKRLWRARKKAESP